MYSRYAIGEIVLVVIGIMIALQINTWNEMKKKQEKYDRQLIKVKKELRSNVFALNSLINHSQRCDSIIYILTNGLLTFDMLEKNKRIVNIIYNHYPVTIEDEEFRILSNIDLDLNKEEDSISIFLKGIYDNDKPVLDK